MATNPLADLVLAAAHLKGASPKFFADLCNSLRGLEVQAISEILASDDPHDLFRAQGKVKTIQLLRKHLNECAELRDTYHRRELNGRPTA
jgi:hypothetical protein